MVRSSSERLLNEVLFSPHTRGWSEDVARLHLVADRSPRTRGDGPSSRKASRFSVMGSPRTRGDGPRADAMRMKNSEVLPAHAGMVRCITLARRPSPSSPRTRGDGPEFEGCHLSAYPVLPAHAGMVRTSPGGICSAGRFSPHTRGWSDLLLHLEDLTAGSPRTRGDGPDGSANFSNDLPFSPHMRGWSAGRKNSVAMWRRVTAYG